VKKSSLFKNGFSLKKTRFSILFKKALKALKNNAFLAFFTLYYHFCLLRFFSNNVLIEWRY